MGAAGQTPGEKALLQHLSLIRAVAERTDDVAEMEPLLRALLVFLRRSSSHRQALEDVLIRLSEDWPPGSVEAVEFTMRELKWLPLKRALEIDPTEALRAEA